MSFVTNCAKSLINRFKFTWNVFSATIAVGQLANVFTALGSGFVRCWLRVQGFRSGWWMAIDIDELLGVFHNCLRRLQRWSSATSVNED